MSKFIVTEKMINTVLNTYHHYDKYGFYYFNKDYYLYDEYMFDPENLSFRHKEDMINIPIYTEKPDYKNTEYWFKNEFLVYFNEMYFDNILFSTDGGYYIKFFMNCKLTFEDFKHMLYDHEVYNEVFAEEVVDMK